MKKFFIEFLKRGLIASSGGPIVMAIIYFILWKTGVVTSIPADEVVLCILTSTLLAFIVAGISAIYQIDKLSTFPTALIHGIVLYATYITIYLINGWLKSQMTPFLVFTGVFIAGYAVIWIIIYISIKRSTKKLNLKINEKNRSEIECYSKGQF